MQTCGFFGECGLAERKIRIDFDGNWHSCQNSSGEIRVVVKLEEVGSEKDLKFGIAGVVEVAAG